MNDLVKIKDLMLEEAKNQLKDEWANSKDYIVENLIELTATLEMIKSLEREKKISSKDAKMHLEVWEKSCTANLVAAKVAAKVGPSKLVNGMVKVGKGVINRYLGFPLL
jgi:hypothetical protein